MSELSEASKAELTALIDKLATQSPDRSAFDRALPRIWAYGESVAKRADERMAPEWFGGFRVNWHEHEKRWTVENARGGVFLRTPDREAAVRQAKQLDEADKAQKAEEVAGGPLPDLNATIKAVRKLGKLTSVDASVSYDWNLDKEQMIKAVARQLRPAFNARKRYMGEAERAVDAVRRLASAKRWHASQGKPEEVIAGLAWAETPQKWVDVNEWARSVVNKAWDRKEAADRAFHEPWNRAAHWLAQGDLAQAEAFYWQAAAAKSTVDDYTRQRWWAFEKKLDDALRAAGKRGVIGFRAPETPEEAEVRQAKAEATKRPSMALPKLMALEGFASKDANRRGYAGISVHPGMVIASNSHILGGIRVDLPGPFPRGYTTLIESTWKLLRQQTPEALADRVPDFDDEDFMRPKDIPDIASYVDDLRFVKEVSVDPEWVKRVLKAAKPRSVIYVNTAGETKIHEEKKLYTPGALITQFDGGPKMKQTTKISGRYLIEVLKLVKRANLPITLSLSARGIDPIMFESGPLFAIVMPLRLD